MHSEPEKEKVPEPFSIQIIFNYSIIDLPELIIIFFSRPSHSKWITSWTLGFNFMLYCLVIHQYSRTGYSFYGRLAKTLLRRWNMHADSWSDLVSYFTKRFCCFSWVSLSIPHAVRILLVLNPVCPFNFFYHQKKPLFPK